MPSQGSRSSTPAPRRPNDKREFQSTRSRRLPGAIGQRSLQTETEGSTAGRFWCFEAGRRKRRRRFLAKMAVPALPKPLRIRPLRGNSLGRRIGDAAQHGVHQPGGRVLPRPPHQLDAFRNRGMRRYAAQKAQLITPQPQCDADLGIEFRRRPPRQSGNPIIQFPLTPQAPQDQLEHQPSVAFIESLRASRMKQFVRKRPVRLHPQQDIESRSPGWGNAHRTATLGKKSGTA